MKEDFSGASSLMETTSLAATTDIFLAVCFLEKLVCPDGWIRNFPVLEYEDLLILVVVVRT
jgi:hypothetical protein